MSCSSCKDPLSSQIDAPLLLPIFVLSILLFYKIKLPPSRSHRNLMQALVWKLYLRSFESKVAKTGSQLDREVPSWCRVIHEADPSRALVMRPTCRATTDRWQHLSEQNGSWSQIEFSQQQHWAQLQPVPFHKARNWNLQALNWWARHSGGREQQIPGGMIANVPIVLLQKEVHVMKLNWQE